MLKAGFVLDGKYRILSVIGQGGMSTVYLAVHERLKQKWAVKEISMEYCENYEMISRKLIVEADILKRLDHPGLPKIVDIIEKKDNEPVVENLLPPPEQPKLPEVIPSQQVVQAAPLQVNDQIPEKVIGTAPVAQVKEAAPLPVSANAQTGDAPEAKVIGLKEAVQQENAKAAQAAQIPTQPKVQPAVQPEPKKPAALAKATAGMWQIQLMSSPNRQAVEKAWISLSKKYKMLQGQPHEIEAADLDFDKTFYRLKAGAFIDRAGADELCKDIKALGGTCIVKKK